MMKVNSKSSVNFPSNLDLYYLLNEKIEKKTNDKNCSHCGTVIAMGKAVSIIKEQKEYTRR